MDDDKKTVVHLKEKEGDAVCIKCNASLADDGAFTYREDVYNDLPPGYRNCRSMWAE